MEKWQKILVIDCSTCLVVAVCAGVGAFFVLHDPGRGIMTGIEGFDQSRQPWMECGVPHPGGTPAVTFLQRSIHPFLAEYEYKIRFGTGTNSLERWLPLNSGGRTRMNAYWYPSDPKSGPTIRLQDRWGEYLVRMQEQKTYMILRYKDRVFAGEITESNPGSLIGETLLAGGELGVDVSVGDNQAMDVTTTTVGQGPGQYFGRIDGESSTLRFVPVSESLEESIDIVK